MTDKKALATDWENIGNDMRYAMGLRHSQLVPKTSALATFFDGIRSLNPFGTMAKDRYNHR